MQSGGMKIVKANESQLWASKDSGGALAAQRRDAVGAVVACLCRDISPRGIENSLERQSWGFTHGKQNNKPRSPQKDVHYTAGQRMQLKNKLDRERR